MENPREVITKVYRIVREITSIPIEVIDRCVSLKEAVENKSVTLAELRRLAAQKDVIDELQMKLNALSRLSAEAGQMIKEK